MQCARNWPGPGTGPDTLYPAGLGWAGLDWVSTEISRCSEQEIQSVVENLRWPEAAGKLVAGHLIRSDSGYSGSGSGSQMSPY